MSYIPSRFNFSYERLPNENVIYNTFSKALVVLSDGEYKQYQRGSFIINDLEDQLVENGILVKDTFDELMFLKYAHYKAKFSNDILFLTIAPTLDCNFACPYCYENRRSGKMSLEVQDAVVSYIQDAIASGIKVLDISWYGGEPLLYLDILESLSRRILSMTETGNCLLKMHLVTNGYLLNQQTIELLDEIGVTRIQVTLDGLKQNHDMRRPLRNGSSTFDKIMGNLKLFSDSPIDVAVRMNVDNQNYSDFFTLKKQLESFNNPNLSIYASPVEDLNTDAVNEVSAFMTKEEFDAFTMMICDEGDLTPDDFTVMDNRRCFCSAETENSYVVDELGNFYKCWDEVGREEHRCFSIVDPESTNYSILARYLTDDPFSDEHCKGCTYLPLCFGGCKFQKLHLKKSICGFTSTTLKKYLEAAFFK